ncbi:MAG: cupin domain-containing protein [Pseudomonadota bacterium]
MTHWKPMKEAVNRFDPQAEFHIDEGCDITELSNSGDDAELSIARARVKPGTKTRWHRLTTTAERYVILEGSGFVEVGEHLQQHVGSGDVVLIPPGCRQRITNTGSSDLVFLALCTPRFSDEVYLDAEE